MDGSRPRSRGPEALFWEAHAVAKFTQLVAVVLVGCAAGAFALAQDEEPAPPAATAERDEELIDDRGADRAAKPGGPHNAAAQATLDHVLPELTFDEVAFADVIDFLRDVTNANIFVNWRALEGAGIDRNAPVSVRLRRVAFGKALDVILDGVGGDEVDLSYEVDRGVITISATSKTHTRAYDVRDILLAKVTAPGADQAKRLATLTKLVTGSVAPATWRGDIAGVRAAEGKLFITQTPENHDAIANLLKHTRALLSLPAVEEPAPVVSEPEE